MRIHIGHHFYGAGNFGDDLMIAGFLQAAAAAGVRAHWTCATPFDRAAQRRRFPEIAWLPYDEATRVEAVRSCDLWLGLGGPAFETDSGSWMAEHLAVETTLCERFRKSMYFLCVGCSNRDALNDTRIRAAIDRAEHIWTRDAWTKRVIDSFATEEKTTAGGDLAQLALAEHRWCDARPHSLAWLLHFDDRTMLEGHAVSTTVQRSSRCEQHWLVQEIRRLNGSELENYDVLPPDIRGQLSLSAPDYGHGSMTQILDAWPVCETVVSSRFHGALAAAWRGAKLVVAMRNDKLRALVETLQCRSLECVDDADELSAAIATAQPVDRRLLEAEREKASQSCLEFFEAAGLPLTERSTCITQPLPDAELFAFDQPFFGDGWHATERDGDAWFCWTREPTSTLDLRVTRTNPLRVQCRILHAISPNALTGLKLFVNDEPIALTWSHVDRYTQVEGAVPAKALADGQGIARIRLQSGEVIRPCDIHADHQEERPLGLAINSIRLLPWRSAA